MRDLLFKNLTSNDKKRKILSSCEISENRGLRTVVRRHFLYTAKEVENGKVEKPQPCLRVLKERDSREKIESFFCRLKSSLYVVYDHRLFLITFVHSLKITVSQLVLSQ